MTRFRFVARLTALALAAALSAAAHSATAQQSASTILVAEGDVPGAYVVVGAVNAETHQKSLFPKTPTKTVLDQQLREAAAKLGADAVIQVRYTMNSALTSTKGQSAIGVAVKYAPSVAAAVAPIAAPAASPAHVETPVPAQAPAPVPSAADAAPAPAVALAEAPATALPPPRAPATTPVAAAAPAPAPAVQTPTGPAQIVLSEQDIPGRAYQRLGEVSVTTHQKSLMPSVSPLDQVNEALRAEAAKLGADAVLMVRYTMRNSMFSKKGNTATGIAVKFQ